MSEDQNPWLAAAAANKEAAQRREQPDDAGERPRGRFHSTRPAGAATANPFLPATPVEPGPVDDEGDYAPVMLTGPAAPTGAPSPADPLLTVPARFDHTRAYPGLLVQVVGLHGGAGTSTIASLLGREAIDCGVGLGHLVDSQLPVVLVARTHGRGLHLVRRAAAQWASGGLEAIGLLGVVLVDDGPVLSKGLHREVKSAERVLPHAWRVAWSEDLRHDPQLPGEADGGRLRRIRKSLLSQAQKLPRETARGTTTTTFTEGTA